MKIYGISLIGNVSINKNLKTLYTSVERANVAMKEVLDFLIRTIQYKYNIDEKDLEIKTYPIVDYDNNEDGFFIDVEYYSKDLEIRSSIFIEDFTLIEDTIESIMSKYNITREELSEYNELQEVKIGDKLIIPEK